AAQRLPQNNCSAHALAVFRWNSRIGQGAFRDFAEHIGFREFLGNNDNIGSRTRINQESRNAAQDQETIWQPGNQETAELFGFEPFLLSGFRDAIHTLAIPRCALMNSVTKGSAGLSRRSVIEPF